MNLKQLLNRAGVSNDIQKALEKKKLTDAEELKCQLDAQKMARDFIMEALGKQQPPSKPKRTIIINE